MGGKQLSKAFHHLDTDVADVILLISHYLADSVWKHLIGSTINQKNKIFIGDNIQSIEIRPYKKKSMGKVLD
jgi:hypothetical protein